MGLVLVSWTFYFLLFAGLGTIVLKLLDQRLDSGWTLLDAFWLGWALSLGFLQVWHAGFTGQ